MNTLLKVSEIQSRVADLIEERGLHKGNFFPENAADPACCPLCLLAAFNVAVGRPMGGELSADASRRRGRSRTGSVSTLTRS